MTFTFALFYKVIWENIDTRKFQISYIIWYWHKNTLTVTFTGGNTHACANQLLVKSLTDHVNKMNISLYFLVKKH